MLTIERTIIPFLAHNNTFTMANTLGIFRFLIVFMTSVVAAVGKNFGSKASRGWYDAHATFYGDISGRDTMR